MGKRKRDHYEHTNMDYSAWTEVILQKCKNIAFNHSLAIIASTFKSKNILCMKFWLEESGPLNSASQSRQPSLQIIYTPFMAHNSWNTLTVLQMYFLQFPHLLCRLSAGYSRLIEKLLMTFFIDTALHLVKFLIKCNKHAN